MMIEADAATQREGGRPIVPRVLEVPEPLVGAGGWHVQLPGDLHVERLVRPLCVVAGEERIEPRLLLERVRRGGPGGLLLEGEVHALVAAILLRGAWFDPLDTYSQAQPPDGQAAQSEQGVV